MLRSYVWVPLEIYDSDFYQSDLPEEVRMPDARFERFT